MLEVSPTTRTAFRTYLPGMTYGDIIDLISSYVDKLAAVDSGVGGTGKVGHVELEDVVAMITDSTSWSQGIPNGEDRRSCHGHRHAQRRPPSDFDSQGEWPLPTQRAQTQ
jgi:hypothetical protein